MYPPSFYGRYVDEPRTFLKLMRRDFADFADAAAALEPPHS
eukprot:gene9465-2832_t